MSLSLSMLKCSRLLKAMLQPLLERNSYHYSEWRSILLTQVEMAKQLGESTVVFGLNKQLTALQEQFGLV